MCRLKTRQTGGRSCTTKTIQVLWKIAHPHLTCTKVKLLSLDCCLDVVWLSEETFASCGADGTINIQKTNTTTPIKTYKLVLELYMPLPRWQIMFRGHGTEINQIKPNPSSTRLASCSDDTTSRIWNISGHKSWVPEISDTDSSFIPVPGLSSQHTHSCVILKGHKAAVSATSWCAPNAPGGHELLATWVWWFWLVEAFSVDTS